MALRVSAEKYKGLVGTGVALALRYRNNAKAMENSHETLRLLTLTEAAKLLHISTKTLQRMIRGGEIPALKVGGQWRLRESQLMYWIQSREGRASSE